jgi:pimeloyl-ACP methyl ester carboxylesterase
LLRFRLAHQQWTPNKLVLVAPFTSMSAMARRAVGLPLAWLLRHHLDNVANLKELLSRSPKPAVTIFHGAKDEVIPVEMGRELAADFPEVRFHEIPGQLHNTIIDSAKAEIQKSMME